MMSPELYYEGRYVIQQSHLKALELYAGICEDFQKQFGRKYHLLETYRTEDAALIVVTAGTITSVSRMAVNKMREQGKKVGLVKLRLFRPVPCACWREALGNVSKLIVVDRNLAGGLGGIFASEIQAALYPLDQKPEIFPVVAGLGGRDVTPEDVEGMIQYAFSNNNPGAAPVYWGLKE
jgi:pyruvate/2-oxoacid:ferredoxin oxidoreductase alpha subunit